MSLSSYDSADNYGSLSIENPCCSQSGGSSANVSSLTPRHRKRGALGDSGSWENFADCGKFEKEYQIVSAENHSNEQTNALTSK